MGSHEQDFSGVRKAEKMIKFGIQRVQKHVSKKTSQKNGSRIFKSYVRHQISFYSKVLDGRGPILKKQNKQLSLSRRKQGQEELRSLRPFKHRTVMSTGRCMEALNHSIVHLKQI